MEQKCLGNSVWAAATLASVHTDCPVDAEGRGEVFQRTGPTNQRYVFIDNKDIQITTTIVMKSGKSSCLTNKRKLQLKQVKTAESCS